MKVLNSSTIRKNLKADKFPPGISEHPNSDRISKYVLSHPDLSIYIEKENVVEVVEVVNAVKMKDKKPISKQKDYNKYKSKESDKEAIDESFKKEE